VRAVPAEGDPLLSNLPSCSYSSAPFGDEPTPQIPVRGPRRRAIRTVDDPTAIPFICPCRKYYRHRHLISLEGGAEEDSDQ
jgi:hypothetical protein